MTKDIESYTGTLYGKQSDEVGIIADYGEVIIVTDKYGNRFPVKAEFLSDEKPTISILETVQPKKKRR